MPASAENRRVAAFTRAGWSRLSSCARSLQPRLGLGTAWVNVARNHGERLPRMNRGHGKRSSGVSTRRARNRGNPTARNRGDREDPGRCASRTPRAPGARLQRPIPESTRDPRLSPTRALGQSRNRKSERARLDALARRSGLSAWVGSLERLCAGEARNGRPSPNRIP